ncbi:aspartate kinase [Candidatus Bathyarchaeota archaeon]|nr:MAG: aspartate kinase [Candidatus Bathyarchaeota archaeon]
MNGEKNEKDVQRLVVKFGGSSLSDGAKISRAINSVIKKAKEGTQIVVVVSAMGKTTDFLIETTMQACGDAPSDEMLDDILAMGERTSARIFSAGLKSHGWKSVYLDPDDPNWPIITDDRFNDARPILNVCEENIRKVIEPMLEDGVIVVVPGFIGKTPDGRITTIGRGGSDITAFILAGALRADQVILVTDVEGIMTADPKIIKAAQRLNEISMDTLVGLADSGTKFIHKKALRYKSPDIDVKVISNSAGSLDSEGTIIRGSFPDEIIIDSYRKPVFAVTIAGEKASESFDTLVSVLEEIRKASVPLLGMSINYNSLILYLPMNRTDELLEALHAIVLKDERALALAVRKNLAFIRVKGVGLEETPGVISRITDALNSAKINIYGIFTITSSVELFVDLKDKDRAIQLIRKALKDDSQAG